MPTIWKICCGTEGERYKAKMLMMNMDTDLTTMIIAMVLVMEMEMEMEMVPIRKRQVIHYIRRHRIYSKIIKIARRLLWH